MLHMPTQEEDPSNPTKSPTYVNQPQRNKNLQASTTHQVAGPHIRLKTLIQTTCATPSKPRSSCGRMPADACKHTRWPEPPEHEDLIQHLRITGNIICITSVVEWQKESNKNIENIQNRCLRTRLPVFTTTPIHAMQIESRIPPLQIRLDHMKQ